MLLAVREVATPRGLLVDQHVDGSHRCFGVGLAAEEAHSCQRHHLVEVKSDEEAILTQQPIPTVQVQLAAVEVDGVVTPQPSLSGVEQGYAQLVIDFQLVETNHERILLREHDELQRFGP